MFTKSAFPTNSFIIFYFKYDLYTGINGEISLWINKYIKINLKTIFGPNPNEFFPLNPNDLSIDFIANPF